MHHNYTFNVTLVSLSRLREAYEFSIFENLAIWKRKQNIQVWRFVPESYQTRINQRIFDLHNEEIVCMTEVQLLHYDPKVKK